MATPRTTLHAVQSAIVAETRPVVAPLPSCFLAAIPSEPAWEYEPNVPPLPWIVHRLLAGDAEMVSRVKAAICAAEDIAFNWAVVLCRCTASEAGAAIVRSLLLDPDCGPGLRERISGLPFAPPEPIRDLCAWSSWSGAQVEDNESSASAGLAAYLFDAPDGPRLNPFDVNAVVRESERGACAVLERRPDAIAEVVVALQSALCDSSETHDRRLQFLRDLGRLHRPTLDDLAVGSGDPLLRASPPFRTPGSMRRYSEDLGLPLDPELEDGAIVLEHALKAVQFDMETDTWPNGHDGILRSLAELVRPALEDVFFWEIPPPGDEEDAGAEQLSDRYRILAFEGGRRWEVIGGNGSDWLDVDLLLGLLNAMLVDRGSDRRLFALPPRGQRAAVFAATSAAVERAQRDGGLSVWEGYGGFDDEEDG